MSLLFFISRTNIISISMFLVQYRLKPLRESGRNSWRITSLVRGQEDQR